jgi:hypothetical protein
VEEDLHDSFQDLGVEDYYWQWLWDWDHSLDHHREKEEGGHHRHHRGSSL